MSSQDYQRLLNEATEIVERTDAKTIQAMLLAHGTYNAEKVEKLEETIKNIVPCRDHEGLEEKCKYNAKHSITIDTLPLALRETKPEQAVREIVSEHPTVKWAYKAMIVVTTLAVLWSMFGRHFVK